MSKSQDKSDQLDEGSHETNVIISSDEGETIDVGEPVVHVVRPTDGMADGIGNIYEEENVIDEEEMQDESLYVVQEVD